MRNRDGGETTSKEHYRSCLREKAEPWQAVSNDRTVYNADKKVSKVCVRSPKSSTKHKESVAWQTRLDNR